MVDTIYQVVNSTCGSIHMRFSILAVSTRNRAKKSSDGKIESLLVLILGGFGCGTFWMVLVVVCTTNYVFVC